jgi:hypothetical protein
MLRDYHPGRSHGIMSAGLSAGAMVGIAVGAVCAVVLVALAAGLYLSRWLDRRRVKARAAQSFKLDMAVLDNPLMSGSGCGDASGDSGTWLRGGACIPAIPGLMPGVSGDHTVVVVVDVL